MQIGGLMTNLTQEYTNFLNFLTTTPSSIQTLINDAKLLNAQLNAVGLRASPLAEFSLLCFPRGSLCWMTCLDSCCCLAMHGSICLRKCTLLHCSHLS